MSITRSNEKRVYTNDKFNKDTRIFHVLNAQCPGRWRNNSLAKRPVNLVFIQRREIRCRVQQAFCNLPSNALNSVALAMQEKWPRVKVDADGETFLWKHYFLNFSASQ